MRRARRGERLRAQCRHQDRLIQVHVITSLCSDGCNLDDFSNHVVVEVDCNDDSDFDNSTRDCNSKRIESVEVGPSRRLKQLYKQEDKLKEVESILHGRHCVLQEARRAMANQVVAEAKLALLRAGPVEDYSPFERLREQFLDEHGTQICEDLARHLARHRSYQGGYMNGTWRLPVVSIAKAPISQAVQDRFMATVEACSGASLAPSYHGTDESNFQSIFQRGLLVPGKSSGIRSVHGQAHGRGIYTAMLRNPELSCGFCSMFQGVAQRPQDMSWWRPTLQGRAVWHASVNVVASPEVRNFLACISVVPWGVLGSQLLGSQFESGPHIHEITMCPANDSDMVIVDPAGLPYILSKGPRSAGGASKAIYQWLGISCDPAFPSAVRKRLRAGSATAPHIYDGHKWVIHAVGPDLRKFADGKRNDVVRHLAHCYHQIFMDFAASGSGKLRLPPISSGIFSGVYSELMPSITAEALARGFGELCSSTQQALRNAEVQLCIYERRSYPAFASSIFHAHACLPDQPLEAEPRSFQTNLLVCGIVDDSLPCEEDSQSDDGFALVCRRRGKTMISRRRGKTMITVRHSSAVKHVGDAIVVADEAHVAPLFIASVGYVKLPGPRPGVPPSLTRHVMMKEEVDLLRAQISTLKTWVLAEKSHSKACAVDVAEHLEWQETIERHTSRRAPKIEGHFAKTLEKRQLARRKRQQCRARNAERLAKPCVQMCFAKCA